jgi:hypothetical protein
MQFSEQMSWDETDFIVWGVMLALAAGTFDLAIRVPGNVAYRMAVGVALVGAFILVWMNLAVGIIGSEDNPANLMYGGVLATGLVGAFVARFRGGGMAVTLGAMALAQLAAGIIALSASLGSTGANWPRVIYVLTSFFAALWSLSAWLLHRASRVGPLQQRAS